LLPAKLIDATSRWPIVTVPVADGRAGWRHLPVRRVRTLPQHKPIDLPPDWEELTLW